MRPPSGLLLVSLLLLPCASGACTDNATPIPGACRTDTSPQLQCGATLVGYSCTGAARPDQASEGEVGGVPHGLVCTDMGRVDGDGSEEYCCSPGGTSCSYDPVPIGGCPAAEYAYECRGSDRPEAFDPSLFCGEGLPEGASNLIVYCCGPSQPPAGCSMITSGSCPGTQTGWTCHDQSLPAEAELGSNQSRADFNVLVCAVPTVTMSSTGTTYGYCCYTPTSLPPGGSCLSDTAVPGCPAKSYGFACTGPETPDRDYPRMNCPSPGVPGYNPQGYAATLYCCQYQ